VTLLDDLLDRPAWFELARCRGVDPNLFFPERGESLAAAKAVCAECPVRAECLGWALTEGEKFGVWGGQSEKERGRIRRAMPPADRRPRSQCGTDEGWRDGCGCGACRAAHNAAMAPSLPNTADRQRAYRARAASR
jgi:WhiB family redox-sensing transcriptional regulator